MSMEKCVGCGRITNSTLSNYWINGEATECYAAWDEEKQIWVKGCAYDKLDRNDKYSAVHFVDKILGG